MDGTASSDVGVEIPEVAVKPEVSKKQNKTMQRITSARMLEAKRAEIDKVLYKKVLSPQYFLVLVLTLAVSIFHLCAHFAHFRRVFCSEFRELVSQVAQFFVAECAS